MSTAVITYEIMWHVNETLHLRRRLQPGPAPGRHPRRRRRGLRHTITLRKGVKFHNGKEMTAADVVPSLKRWGQVASLGKQLWANVESVEARTRTRSSCQAAVRLAALRLAEPHGAIYPKEVIEAAGEGPLKEYTGTGPTGSSSTRPTGTSSWPASRSTSRAASRPAASAASAAYFDEILFIPVPDTAVRLAGVETGEYHHAMFVKQDSYDRIKSCPSSTRASSSRAAGRSPC